VAENPERVPVAPVADVRAMSRSLLLRAWRGEAHLSQVFWLIFFRGFAVVFLLSIVFFWTFGPTAPIITTATVIGYTVLFSLFVLVSVYRCAWRTAQLGWGTLASLVVIVASGVIVVFSLHGLRVQQVRDVLRQLPPTNAPSNTAPHTDARDRPASTNSAAARAGGRER